jgi:hypothetical protein
LKTGNDLVTELYPNLAFSCLPFGTGRKKKPVNATFTGFSLLLSLDWQRLSGMDGI